MLWLTSRLHDPPPAESGRWASAQGGAGSVSIAPSAMLDGNDEEDNDDSDTSPRRRCMMAKRVYERPPRLEDWLEDWRQFEGGLEGGLEGQPSH